MLLFVFLFGFVVWLSLWLVVGCSWSVVVWCWLLVVGCLCVLLSFRWLRCAFCFWSLYVCVFVVVDLWCYDVFSVAGCCCLLIVCLFGCWLVVAFVGCRLFGVGC